MHQLCPATLPSKLATHARIQTRKTNPKGPQPLVQSPRFEQSPSRRSSHTACRFAWLLELPLVAEAAELSIQGISLVTSATEESLGLGAASAELLGGGVSCAIEVFGVEFLASLPEAPAFLVSAVEADWLAAIGASVINKVETSALADLAVAKLEASEATGMVALSEEKQIEFACGILSRVSPSQLADLIEALFVKVVENPSLLGKLPQSSMEVAIQIFEKSPQAKEVLIEVLKRLAGEAMPIAVVGSLSEFIVQALSAEKVLELLSAAPLLLPNIIEAAVQILPQEQLLEWTGVLASKASADLLQQIISSTLTVLPEQKLLELGAVFVSQASPDLLGKVILTAAEVWPVEKVLEIGSGLLPKLSADLLQQIISSTLTVLPEQKLLELGAVFVSQASPDLLGKVILTAAEVWPVEKVLEIGSGLLPKLSADLLQQIISSTLTVLPEQKLLELGAVFVSQASPDLLGKVILTAAEVWPVEKGLEIGSGLLPKLSADLLQQIISSALKVLPEQKLLELGAVFVSQASPDLLGKVILTAAEVWPVEKGLEIGSGLLSQLPQDYLVKLFYTILQSAPEKFELLSMPYLEAARETAESFSGKVFLPQESKPIFQSSEVALDVLSKPSLEAAQISETAQTAQSFIGKELPSAKLTPEPLEFGEYEAVMVTDAVLSAVNQTAVQGNATKNIPQEVVGVGKAMVGLGASLGVKQLAVLAGASQGPILFVLGMGASWKAKELYQEVLDDVKLS
eukprot:Skav200549  [mRNA]  locus=scaffold676:525364:527595:- [translate_table: standard]